MANQLQTIRMRRSHRRGFTLLELSVTLIIVSILLTVGTVAFSSARRHTAVANARNAIVNYAGIARSYAIANQIETMFVINPYNGRFEIWHLNPPVDGGEWDPNSDSMTPGLTDGYAFAPVLDSDARLPIDGNGDPTVIVSPIDYQERVFNGVTGTRQEFDNLIWTALCFDENGTLVTRTRRIATRTAVGLDGTLTGIPTVNRTSSAYDASVKDAQAPDLRLLDPNLTPGPTMMVTVNDTPITSTIGFVISERKALESVYGQSFNAAQLAGNNGWLMNTRYSAQYSDFSEEVLLDRYSAEPLNEGEM